MCKHGGNNNPVDGGCGGGSSVDVAVAVAVAVPVAVVVAVAAAAAAAAAVATATVAMAITVGVAIVVVAGVFSWCCVAVVAAVAGTINEYNKTTTKAQPEQIVFVANAKPETLQVNG